MGLWTYLCYLISVVLYCGLCIGFWFLCVLWFDFSWVLVDFDFSVFFGLISLWYGLVMISLFFGLISYGYGLFWFLYSLVDFSWVWVGFDFSVLWFLMDLGFDFSVIWVWVFNFSVLYVDHLSAIILHDQSRFNIFYFSSFEDIFCQLDPNYYVYLLMPNKVSLAAIPVNWLKNFEGQLLQYLFFFFFHVFTPTKGGAVFCFALYL